jgi:Zn-dependent protease with chaperone function
MTPPPPIAVDALVPAWLHWAGRVVVPAAFVISFGVAWVVGAIFVRKLPVAPWTERARASYPGRLGVALAGMVFAIAAGVFGVWLAPRMPGEWPHAASAVAGALAGYLGADFVRLTVERRAHGRWISARSWFSWKPTVFTLYALQLVPLAVGAALVDDRFDARTWTVLFIMTLVSLALYAGLGWLGLWSIGVIRPATMRLRASVDRAAIRTGVRPRALGILPTFGVPFANAFALPILRRVAFTSEALAVLDDEEIEAIAAHELGHVGEPRMVALARIARGFILLPVVVVRPLYTVMGWAGPLIAFVVLIAIVRLNAILSRKMEERADAIAHHAMEGASEARRPDDPATRGSGVHSKTEGPVYARALEKLYIRNLVPAVMTGKRRIHPDLWDRMVKAGVTPPYPKPAPPKMRRVMLGAMAIVYVACLVLAGVDAWVKYTVEADASAFIAKEARNRLENGDAENAYELYLSAMEIDDHAALHVGLAWAEAALDICDEAAKDLAWAYSRKRPDPDLDDAMINGATRALGECMHRRYPYSEMPDSEMDDE